MLQRFKAAEHTPAFSWLRSAPSATTFGRVETCPHRFRIDRSAPIDTPSGTCSPLQFRPVVNAFCTVTSERALAEAEAADQGLARGEVRGPLHGIPVSIKDLIQTRGVRTTMGSRVYADFIPDEDAPLVSRLKAAGVILLGKTNTPEFGWKSPTDNLLFGPTRNPWDLTRTSAGSSGGAAAAVACGPGPIGIGGDGGGSIRQPASFCGVFGLKPSFGLVPNVPPGVPGHLFELRAAHPHCTRRRPGARVYRRAG